ncbi:family 16 glycosylhydrolase [Flammeovirga sp. OC4]|uniref:family 16 glycosylhydrolase n=1 Tax=Flammeovirga sp. OC4 TaxID=1382345 RepID=UPI0006949BD3|nr:family 16 glycosylhydrolase [Flammeovirga sp. OC4]
MNKITKLIQLLFLAAVFTNNALAQTPVSHPDLVWEKEETHSDEFESLDTDKWENDPNDWGVWSWEPSLAYVENNELRIRMIQETHRRNTHFGQNEELYYKSGIIRNNQTITYGYFEAKIKGADRFPGVSPAFWLYSINQPDPTEDGQAKYSEIDVVELTQKEWDFDKNEWEGPEAIDMNLHAVARENGELVQIRPHGKPEIAQNKWYADFDPRDDYHTYGVLSRVDSIFWYIDGIERGRKENLYWHLPMHITVSMGLRNPFVKYVDGVRYPVADSTTTVGFPTEMACQYVRVWKAASQIQAYAKEYENVEFGKNNGLNFNCYFDAGSGFKSTSNMDVELVEMNASSEIVKVAATSQASINGKAAGQASAFFNLQGVSNSAQLEAGHYYEIHARFTSSKENQTVELTPLKNILIVDEVTSIDQGLGNKIEIFPNPALESIKIKGLQSATNISIHSVSGNVMLEKEIAPQESIDISEWVNGVYIIKVSHNNVVTTKRFVKL